MEGLNYQFCEHTKSESIKNQFKLCCLKNACNSIMSAFITHQLYSRFTRDRYVEICISLLSTRRVLAFVAQGEQEVLNRLALLQIDAVTEGDVHGQ